MKLKDFTARKKWYRYMTILQKLYEMDWVLVFLLSVLAFIGMSMLYSVAGGNFQPWAVKQAVRFIMALFFMIVVAVVDIRIWYKLAWPLFFASVGLLVAVELVGEVGMGAQRWIDLKVIKLQPSEIMKISVILVVARFYNRLNLYQVSSFWHVTWLFGILAIPVILVFRQPDLGTAILIVAGGLGVGLVAGISWKWFTAGAVGLAGLIPLVWTFILRPYQQNRVRVFLDSELDPLGKGYNIIQSKITIGSGGMTGRGFMQGTQSNLGFLPERHTDFIFAVVAEELGFVGAISLLLLIFTILFKTMIIAINTSSKFAKLMTMGMGITFFLYIFINAGMVMGLLPVVGVPFPLLSYGGTVMITVMVAFGFVQNAHIHRYRENPELPA